MFAEVKQSIWCELLFLFTFVSLGGEEDSSEGIYSVLTRGAMKSTFCLGEEKSLTFPFSPAPLETFHGPFIAGAKLLFGAATPAVQSLIYPISVSR